MKLRVLIGLLIVSVLCVSQVTGQCSDSATASCSASGQKTGAACSSTSAQLTSTDGASKACCASKTQTAAQLASLTDKPSACCASKAQLTATACSSTASTKLAGLTAQPSACSASKTQATACSSTAPAKLASAAPGCPMQAAGIQLCAQQQAKMHAILAQARKDLLAVLNSEQQAKFAKFTQGAQMSLMPVVIGRQASLTTTAATSTQACCASKAAAQTVALTTTEAAVCSGECEKACCTAKTQTVAEQTTCPIMGSPVKKTVFTVYQGKKVYFCCKGCDKAFNKNPEKYTKNLPQF